MNLSDTLQLIQGLRAQGASHFKSNDFEVTFSGDGRIVQSGMTEDVPAQTPTASEDPTVHFDAKAQEEATKKLKDLIGTLSLSPEALADRIFPDGANP